MARTSLDDGAPLSALDGVSGPLTLRCTSSEGAWARIVELARAARLPVGVWAERPPSPAEIALAADAGVRELGLALHGARSEVHDWHASAGSFESALRALGVARTHGIRTAVLSRITRSNARVLVELPSLLKASGVALWVLAWPRAEGDAFTAVVPRLGLGVPPALAALERARRVGLEARVAGVPACVLGPFASSALPASPRAFGARCAGCASRPACSGVDAAYLARFGEAELRAMDELASTRPEPSLAPLARLGLS